jgi:hypothetical protein
MRLWLAAVLVLSAQTATTFHTLLVHHARCLEHGELVDAAPERARFTLDNDPTPHVVATPSGETHAHEHCAIAMLERQRLSRGQAIDLSVVAPTLAQAPAAPVVAAFMTPARLLRLAPKHSPPCA